MTKEQNGHGQIKGDKENYILDGDILPVIC
jgi:hypothetical protein